jgi:hypothetical protein
LLFWDNLRYYRPCPFPDTDSPPSAVSVLIPARNEQKTIRRAVEAALASHDADVEVIVFDDHSEDRTSLILAALAASDARVQLSETPPLPKGWCGKQHACAVLAAAATKPLLVFIDADVVLAPEAVGRMAAFMTRSGTDLASGIPCQKTGTLLEKILIPLIHFILLGFLPVGRMRASSHPSHAAGCGQLFIARRAAYMAMGGHAAIRDTLHDGLKLPRAFRAAGFTTDLFDATDLACCRMYDNAADVWHGLAKNAIEGLAAPLLIVPATLLLVGGQVVPFILLVLLPLLPPPAPAIVVGAALVAWSPRFVGTVQFRQSALGAVVHPFGVLMLLAIQWYALARWLLGRPAAWKGRRYVR